MMDRAAAQNLLDYHPPTGDQAAIYQRNREVFTGVMDHVFEVLPEPSPERTLTIRMVSGALRELNGAVAVTGAGAAPSSSPS